MNMRNQNSLFEPRNDEQRDQQQRVQNFGAGENFLDQCFKHECIHLAFEAVDEIIASHQSGEEEIPGISQEDKDKIIQNVSGVLEGKIATESVVDAELTDKIIVAVNGEPEKPEKPTAWEIFESIACEAVGIDGEEKPTPEQLEDYRNVSSQMVHALGYLGGTEKGSEMAMESVNDEDSEGLLRTCTFIDDQLNHHGIDDEELAIEYVLNAPTVGDEDENGEIAIEKTVVKFVGGVKKRIKKRAKKIRGAALAALKKIGRKLGKKPKKGAAIRKMKKSMLKRKKAGM